MRRSKIGAVSFDLWDCLFIDDSDEPKRKAAGQAPKPEARRALVHEFLNRHEATAREQVDLAYDVTDAAFNHAWHDTHITWTVRDRLAVLLKGMGRELPADDFDELVRLHEGMELEFRPDPAPGARDALAALHGKYPLAIISDAIFSPGTALRELLDGAAMLEFFDHFVFSDELGRSKPHPSVFENVATAFDAPVTNIVHIGDRPHNDIGGPHAVGARSVLLTVVKTRPLGPHEPDAICSNYAALPEILADMDAAD